MNTALSNMQKAVSYIKKVFLNKQLGRRAFVLLPGFISFAVVLVIMLTFNVSVATAVSYNGKTIGYVSSETVYTDTIEKMELNMDDEARAELQTVDAKESLTSSTEIMDEKSLERAIVNSIDTVDTCYVLYKNGISFAACESKTEIENALNYYLTEKANGMENAEFVDSFEIKRGYRTNNALITGNQVYDLLNTEDVMISGVKTVTKTVKTPFKTVTKKSNKYSKGEKVVVTKGEKGKKVVEKKVYYSGNKVIAEEILNTKTIKKPKSQVVVYGTSKNRISLSFPFSSNTSYSITSPYGDWRGGYAHQGIDIIANYGTDILACAGGTVIEAGYSYGGWGNNVVIDHGNGMKTRYAHCSSLNVSVGQKVSRGDIIAFVGSTGDSTCNHLHLELVKNGVRINAADYFVD